MDPQVEHVNGDGSSESIDLATTQVTTKVPEGEIGSAYDQDRLFTRFDDGKYFETRDLWTQDFETMLRLDGKARTLEQVLTLPLMSAEHSIEPAQGDSGEATFVTDALTQPANAGGMSTPLDLVIGQMTSAIVRRRAFFEKVFTADEGRVRYAKLAFRPARTCYLLRDKTDFGFRGIKQRFLRDGDTKEVTIPPQKSFVYLHGQHLDPLNGASAFDTAYSAFESKQKIRFLWFSFLENQVLPKAIAHHNAPDADQQQKFAEKVASLKSGGVVGIGPDQDVTAFSTAGQGGVEFKTAMDYLDSEMSGSVLAGFTDLTSAAASGKGSYALSKDSSDFFLQSVIATLSEMAAAFTSWVVADLCLYNFGTGAAVPTFTFKPPAQEIVDKAFELLQQLATATQPVQVPRAFIDLLTEKVAAYLGLDVDAVRKAITEKQEQTPDTPAGKLIGASDAAMTLVRQAGLAQGAAA